MNVYIYMNVRVYVTCTQMYSWNLPIHYITDCSKQCSRTINGVACKIVGKHDYLDA